MGERSKIEWTESSWNPIRARHRETGRLGWHCTHASEGCRNCYAESMNRWRGTGLAYKPGHERDIEVFLDDKILTQPLRWRRPRMIFVCSMTDLFADFVTDEMIDKVFAVMALSPQHTFQVLTKRSERMRGYLSDPNVCRRVYEMVCDMVTVDAVADVVLIAPGFDPALAPPGRRVFLDRWPLPNVWAGTSVEDQATADARTPELLATPAAVRWISAEPLLGPVDLTAICWTDEAAEIRANALTAEAWVENSRSASAYSNEADGMTRLDWVVCGGESGPRARPMHPDWARSLRDQCAAASVPFFFKQWGEWLPLQVSAWGDLGGDVRAGRAKIVHPAAQTDVEVYEATGGRGTVPGSLYMRRVGKRRAGRLLAGVIHDGYPPAHRPGQAELRP
jgi:protein gp37